MPIICPFMYPAMESLWRGLSIGPRLCGCIQLGACEEVRSVMLLYVANESDFVWFEASTLCRYAVRKGDLFVLSCARVRRYALVSVASVVFIVGVAVCSSLLFFLLLR